MEKDDGEFSIPLVVCIGDFEILLNSFSPVLSPVKYFLLFCASVANEIAMMIKKNEDAWHIVLINLIAVY